MRAQSLASYPCCTSRFSLTRPAAQGQTQSLNASARYVQCGPWRHSLNGSTHNLDLCIQHVTGHCIQSGARRVAVFSATAAVVSASGPVPTGEPTIDQHSTKPTEPAIAVDTTFTSSYGTQWRVRRYDNSDYAAIIEVQTDSFHTTNPVPFLNDLTYNNFRAEVVDALRQKTKYSDPASFQLLVAEQLPEAPPPIPPSTAKTMTAVTNASPESLPTAGSGDGDSSVGTAASRICRSPSSGSSSESGSGNSGEVTPLEAVSHTRRESAPLVGCVEVSLMGAREVLRALPCQASEYAYISSMCVRTSVRRRGAAQALMAAAEAQAQRWRKPHLALHVYKDNVPAVELYRRCGMRVIAEDPAWKGMLGGRVRLLMYKEMPLASEEKEGVEDEGEDGEAEGAFLGDGSGKN